MFDNGRINLSSKGSFTSNFIIVICLLTTAYAICRFAYRRQQFGRFYDHIKSNPLHHRYFLAFPLTILSSILLMAYLPSYPIGPAMPALFFFIYILLYRPYDRFMSNLRSAFNFLILIISTLVSWNYKTSTAENNRYSDFTSYCPLILLVLLTFSIIFTTV
jgi:hypothetical protein